MRNKSEYIMVYMTRQEKEVLKKLARKESVNLSEWVRRQILKEGIRNGFVRV